MKKIVAIIATVAMFTAGSTMLSADGAKLFKKKCSACHSTDGKKKVGPTLKGIYGTQGATAGVKLDDAGLFKWIRDPKALNPKSKMGKMFKSKSLSDDDIKAIIAYIKTLK